MPRTMIEKRQRVGCRGRAACVPAVRGNHCDECQPWRGCDDGKAMSFIPPMLATRLEDPRQLADPRYSAEPKVDGQRAQAHIHDTTIAPSTPSAAPAAS